MKLLAFTVALVSLSQVNAEEGHGAHSTIILYKESYGENQLIGLKNWFNRPGIETFLRNITNINRFDGRLIDQLGDGNLVNNLILITDAFPSSFNTVGLVEFAKRGGNLLWILPSELPSVDSTTQALALEFGRILDAHPATIVDYYQRQTESGQDSPGTIPIRVTEDNLANLEGMASRVFPSLSPTAIKKGERFKAVSHRLDLDNPLVFPILTARKEALGLCRPGLPSEKCISPFGAENIVASALESRIGSRVVIITSDSWLQGSGLSPLMQELLRWNFKETGKLVAQLEHWRLFDQPVSDEFLKHDYRSADRMIVRACFLGDQGPTQPSDVQVELSLLETNVRADLLPDGNCLQSTAISLPVRSGVYRLRVLYQRRGWPHIDLDEELTIRPLEEDEIPRFHPPDVPFYMAWIGTMIAALSITPILLKARY